VDLTTQLQDTTKGLFPGLLGISFSSASKHEIRAEMLVTEGLCTTPGILHGGAVMAFADTLGAYGTFLNLPQGGRTSTIESKTNFFNAGRLGTTIVGESRPLHRGRTTMVWQTQIKNEDVLIALVTQTQIILPRNVSEEEQLAGIFAGRPIEEQQAVLARLERSGAALYRAWAKQETDPERRAVLLEAADREIVNAESLEEGSG
jgi:1,4-dihydroxy-2-naphthoyl-CoA hydrolase